MAVTIPHLRKTAQSAQLIVDGKPFLMLAGELQNSSFSSHQHMQEVWPKLKAANLNTVLASVSWEQIEPEEGAFDFQDLDQNIYGARAHGLRLVLLWFGSFKNGLSTYVPPWVKKDEKRFPRAKLGGLDGKLITADILSIYGHESQRADAKAFGKLLKHLEQVDGEHSTVIMVQVENEIGLLGDSRDRSPLAEQRFRDTVPEKLLDMLLGDQSQFNEKLRSNFSHLRCKAIPRPAAWEDLSESSDCIDELFMAYHYALYAETVASAGKSAYPLPLYTNVWQNYAGDDRDTNMPIVAAGGSAPGTYPSGGGVDNVLDIWKQFAPSLDFIAPDIYLNDYASSCAKYRHANQPLFIPEQRRDEYGARRVWEAFGSFHCMGTAPFGIDTVDPEENPFRRHYGLLAAVSQHVLQAQGDGNKSIGFFFDEIDPTTGNDPSPPLSTTLAGWDLVIERCFVFGKPASACGMVIHLAGDQFLLVGWGFQVKFESRDSKAHFTGILRFEEREVVDCASGQMRTLRLLNGDETRSGKFAMMPSEDPDYGGFPICVTIPARTGIAMCEPYALCED